MHPSRCRWWYRYRLHRCADLILSATDKPGPDNASDTYIGAQDIGTLSAQSVLD